MIIEALTFKISSSQRSGSREQWSCFVLDIDDTEKSIVFVQVKLHSFFVLLDQDNALWSLQNVHRN